MWYAGQHETSYLCSHTLRGGALDAGERLALLGCLCLASLLDRARQPRAQRAPRIAEQLGCDDQTVPDMLHAFNARGLQALQKGSSRTKRTCLVFSCELAERLWALLHHSPRDFGKATSVWTVDAAAQASVAHGIVITLVSGESIRQSVLRLGINWKQAKR